ncbi:MAG: hypothetical protein V2J19_00535 [Wenzhouxiangella sp.]|jgi:hypothetical protein|nr:hypothetical protein [Wenzhouxiangella sp.]
MSRFSVLFLVVFVSLIAGCASVTTGRHQTISVDAPNCPQASCVLTNSDGTFHVDRTPGTAEVNKSCSGLTVECSKPGYPVAAQQVKAGFQSMTIGNALIGGLIGLGVDAITGAACIYPSMIVVDMDCGGPVESVGIADASGNADEALAAEQASGIPSYVWDAVYAGYCGDVEHLGDGEEGESYYSATCQAEKKLLTCADEACELSEYRSDPVAEDVVSTESAL